MKLCLYSIGIVAIGLMLFLGCSSEKQENSSSQTSIQRDQLPAGVMHYTAPEAWIAEHPSSSMRLGQYRLPGVDGAADGVLAVYNFPGTGGSVEANLERWYSQMKQPDGSNTKEKIERKDFMVNEIPVAVVYVTGTYLESSSGMMMGGDIIERLDYAMLAAIAETASSPWFFKATGPKKTIDKHRETFNRFVKTLRVIDKKMPT